ncbi:hypothetical protein [Fontivita pretiosa]|uniref:hypothetical protein n=1 Tax=Fontivita pretiosa TaxID=2989684 RepID=UPI003D17B6D7
MRTLFAIPLAVIVTAAAGLCLAAGIGWDPHPHAMLAAAVVTLLSGAGAATVLLWTRHADQAGVAQAALLGLSLHLLGSLALGGAVWAAGVPLSTPYALWLLAFYWVTLTVLAAGFVHQVRSAPLTAAGHNRRPNPPSGFN